MNPPAVHIATHGCRTNTSDSSALALALTRRGFVIQAEPAGADVIVINSCTVTAGADRDTGKALRRARRDAPDALLVLAGCLPVAFPDHAALANADLVLPGADAAEGARRISERLKESFAEHGSLRACSEMTCVAPRAAMRSGRKAWGSTSTAGVPGGTSRETGAPQRNGQGCSDGRMQQVVSSQALRAQSTVLSSSDPLGPPSCQSLRTSAFSPSTIDHRPSTMMDDRRTDRGPCCFPLEEALHLSRFNLKIQEGCSGSCAYCIVPTARGTPRSRPASEVLAELASAVDAGFEEVVLAGTNLLTYRWSTSGEAMPAHPAATRFPLPGRGDLADLMDYLDRNAPPCRIRISSLEPQSGMERVVAALASSPRWCRHLHLSLQHGADAVLEAMGRPYRYAMVEALAMEAHLRIPSLAVGMDVIVGFPTETDAQFGQCLERLEDLPFAYLHVFPWSPRPGTRAAALPQLEPAVVKERSARLRALSNARRAAFAASLAGQEASVLLERRRDASGHLIGLTDNYMQVTVDGPDEWMRRVVHCRLERGPGGRLVGKPSQPGA